MLCIVINFFLVQTVPIIRLTQKFSFWWTKKHERDTKNRRKFETTNSWNKPKLVMFMRTLAHSCRIRLFNFERIASSSHIHNNKLANTTRLPYNFNNVEGSVSLRGLKPYEVIELSCCRIISKLKWKYFVFHLCTDFVPITGKTARLSYNINTIEGSVSLIELGAQAVYGHRTFPLLKFKRKYFVIHSCTDFVPIAAKPAYTPRLPYNIRLSVMLEAQHLWQSYWGSSHIWGYRIFQKMKNKHLFFNSFVPIAAWSQ